VDLSLQLEVLAAAGVGVEAGPLSDDADRAAHPLGVADDVQAGHVRRAAVCP
jgi:hypothetical protein